MKSIFTAILTLATAVAVTAEPRPGLNDAQSTACWSTRALVSEARSRRADPGVARQALLALKDSPNFATKAHTAWTLALGAEAFASSDPALSQQLAQTAERVLSPFREWLRRYGQTTDAHGRREPSWINGQPEAVAMAMLAWMQLDQVAPAPDRRELVQKFAEGLVALHHPAPHQYPFGAHVSFAPGRPNVAGYAPVLERASVAAAPVGNDAGEAPQATYRTAALAPGAQWVPQDSRQVQALALASQYLGDKNLLEEAQTEALGIWTSLVVSDRLPEAFVPLPEGDGNACGASVAYDQFKTLERVTGNALYTRLAGLAGNWRNRLHPQNDAETAALRLLPLEPTVQGARDVVPPVTYQTMDAAQGKAVQKAFDAIDIVYPSGDTGKMVRVGRENMFWMRFDVDREDDYHFYLIFLKSPLEGGLVSVMMRIDGDKIIQVPLGGASDPYVDMDFVDGPRLLRQGPHSFGIRFSGLLMTQPALLDSVVAWPVVERRFLQLDGQRRMLILHNRSPKEARTSLRELPYYPVDNTTVVDGAGRPASLTRLTDKRRHKEYLMVPAGGTAILEWNQPAK